MADSKKKKGFSKKSVKRLVKKGGTFGSYPESTGGGQPLKGGRGAWKKGGKKEKRDPSQPRNPETGRFEYNAVNGKPLKDISKDKNGDSRGTTIPSTLTGGIDGIHYYEAEPYYKWENGKKVIAGYKKKSDGKVLEGADDKVAELLGIKKEEVFHKGDKIAYKGGISIIPMDMIRAAQEYHLSAGEKEIADKFNKDGTAWSEITSAMKEAGVFGTGKFEEGKGELRAPEGKDEEAAVRKAAKPGMSGKQLLSSGKPETVEELDRKKFREDYKSKDMPTKDETDDILDESEDIDEVVEEFDDNYSSGVEGFVKFVKQASWSDQQGLRKQMDDYVSGPEVSYLPKDIKDELKDWDKKSFEDKIRLFYKIRNLK